MEDEGGKRGKVASFFRGRDFILGIRYHIDRPSICLVLFSCLDHWGVPPIRLG